MVFVSGTVECLLTSSVAEQSRAGSLGDSVVDSVVEDIPKLLRHVCLGLEGFLGPLQDLVASEAVLGAVLEEVVVASAETGEDLEEVDMAKAVAALATKVEEASEDAVGMEVNRMASVVVNHLQTLPLARVARAVLPADLEDMVTRALRTVPAMAPTVVVGMVTREEVADPTKIEALIVVVETTVIEVGTVEEVEVAATVSR